MATYATVRCPQCGAGAEVSGPHEFGLEEGHRVLLPHPSTVAADGLLFSVWCPTHGTQEWVAVEFRRPQNPWTAEREQIREEYLAHYSGFLRDNPGRRVATECLNLLAIRCPVCEGPVAHSRFPPGPCPRCGGWFEVLELLIT